MVWLSDAGLVVDNTRPTTLKHRFISGGSAQLIRLDREKTENMFDEIAAACLAAYDAALADADVVVFSDYAKGVCTASLVEEMIRKAVAADKPMIVDTKPAHVDRYKGASIFTPNWKEANEMVAHGENPEETLQARLEAHVLITKGGEGMILCTTTGEKHHIPARKVQVADVTGAGDTIVATLALGLAAGMEYLQAAEVANVAGGLVVQKAGTATITQEQLVSQFAGTRNVADVDIVEKLWGWEKWLENNEKYCCKVLHLNKGFQCSLHYHKNKDEVFLVTKGHVRLELGEEVHHLHPGAYVRVKQGMEHRFAGMEDSEMIEVSTFHEDDDSYRIETSRAMDNPPA